MDSTPNANMKNEPAQNSLRVLVADDSPQIRDQMQFVLSTIPQVELSGLVQDTGAAIDFAHNLNPDVVILDIHMPGGGGIQALEEIKKTDQPPIVIMFSAFSYPQLRDKCAQTGSDYFFDKNSESDQLIDLLHGLSAIS